MEGLNPLAAGPQVPPPLPKVLPLDITDYFSLHNPMKEYSLTYLYTMQFKVGYKFHKDRASAGAVGSRPLRCCRGMQVCLLMRHSL